MGPLRIGVFVESVQLSDIACIDLLGNCSKEYISVAAQFGFGHFLPVAVEMEWLYISSSLDAATMTPCVMVIPTHTYDSAPRDLDILVVGGPPLDVRPEASLKYLREASAEAGCKVIMSTCVGSLWLADAGILKGKQATTNRGALPMAKQFHPEAEWVDQRWVIDESGPCKFWTSGGAGAGVDMLATYAKEHFDESLVVEAAWLALDVDPTVRGQFYAAGTRETWVK